MATDSKKELSKINPFRKCHVNESKNISRHATFVTEPMRDWPEGSHSLPRSTYQKTLPPLTLTTSNVIVTRGRLGLGAGNCRFVGKIYKLFQTLFTVLCSVVSFLVPRERVPRPNCIIKCKLWLWKEYDFMFYTLSSRPLLYTFLSERKKMFSATRINNLT